MKYRCKICAGLIVPRYTIQAVTYYYCRNCNFLQNFYWEDRNAIEDQAAVNAKARLERWPAGEADHMHEKGWNMLGLMGMPLAWYARRLHVLLKRIPGYERLSRAILKKRFQRTLDFGCGYGVAVLEMRKRDNLNIVGLDPFSPVVDANIICSHLLEHRFSSQFFDGIFTIETMEHITNPVETFAELHRILKPGGVLLVQTSRLEDENYDKQKDEWFYLQDPKTHVSIYSGPAFREIAKRVGFSAVQFKGAKFARFTR